jgi:predicted glycogen debranching enzyme
MMKPIVRRLDKPRCAIGAGDVESCPEWLVTNGLGGYASGTVTGPVTRRYHGLLIAALPAPLGRVLMLSGLIEEIHLADGGVIDLGATGEVRRDDGSAALELAEFRLEMGLPVWRYESSDLVLEKRLHMPYRQNSVHITYRIESCAARINLRLRPLAQRRQHESPVSAHADDPYVLTVVEDRYEIATGTLPALRFFLHGAGQFVVERRKIEWVDYPLERQRGYEFVGKLWSPGSFHVDCAAGDEITLVASTENWEIMRALGPAQAWQAEHERRTGMLAAANPGLRSGIGAELVLAADQFLAVPAGRLLATTRAYAAGDEMRTVIAGYHWFTDWGRDTMISLEGLTLATNRLLEAAWILRNFADSIRDGLLPNFFPEHNREGLYHTADATLWFFHAIDRYVSASGDRRTLRLLLPRLIEIIEHHLHGTGFGIGVDEKDGLLHQGMPGYQLTWMDAKVDDWVVTPRRGKAVEINALWYNALMLMQQWLSEEGDDERARQLRALAERARKSFNHRFWRDDGYLNDVVDGEAGDDAAFRPNQILAISLPHPALDRQHWQAVTDKVRERLLTPVGLRSLAPGHPDYKAKYFGDLRTRDAAYHQGTVWAWLIGPFIDAWLKVHPEDRAGARKLLEGFIPHLNKACIGSISEIFDAESPYTARGCISQAWSVAEVLRCWLKTGADK